MNSYETALLLNSEQGIRIGVVCIFLYIVMQLCTHLIVTHEHGTYIFYPSYWYLQNVFALDVWTFSTLKYRVKGGTNSCNLWVILKLKTYSIFINEVVVHSVYHC